jgi:hypothetical protein
LQEKKIDIAAVIRQFGSSFIHKHKPNSWQLRTLDALSKCRTSALGGHKYQCNHCGKEHIVYNSCRNRHCPKCQGAENNFWIEDRISSVLPVKHYHLVFTIPETLNRICMLNSRWFFNQLFAAVWSTLRQFGYTHFGVESGAISVLHTWGQNLSLHPHIHCIVPAAGLSLEGELKHIGKNGQFLYPVRNLSHVFRGKLMETLNKHPQQLQIQHKTDIKQAWKSSWVVFCEPSFGKPEHVIGYLGQYIHRIAISNQRILDITQTHVKFRFKDYHDGEKFKIMTVTGEEFLRRFCLHILPKGFVKTRYYGIYHNRFCNGLLRQNEQMQIEVPETKTERIKRLTGYDMFLCPLCKIGKLLLVEIIPKARSPSLLYQNEKHVCV